MIQRNRGVLLVSPDFLASTWALPPGHAIVDAGWRTSTGTIELVIEGPLMPAADADGGMREVAVEVAVERISTRFIVRD